MRVREIRREEAIERMADHLLQVGLGGASLRPMAAAAGASDRMLLYYFADKDDVLAATLQRIAERLSAQLDQALPPGVRLPYPTLLRAVWTAAGTAALQPFMNIWLELAAASGRGIEPHRTIASAIAQGFHAWILDHLEAREADRGREAALLFGTLEGLLLLDALGRRDLAEQALGDPP